MTNSYILTNTDEINSKRAMGAIIRSEKIKKARSISIAIHEHRKQQQEVLEHRLNAHEMGLTELRNMVNDWKGDTVSLRRLETVILMKEKECSSTRKLVEASFRWESSSLQSQRKLLKRRLALPRQPSLSREVMIWMEEKECKESAALEAEARNKLGNTTPRKASVTRQIIAPCA